MSSHESVWAQRQAFPFLPRPSPAAPTFLLLFAQCPRASFVLAPLGLKETETTATQANFSDKTVLVSTILHKSVQGCNHDPIQILTIQRFSYIELGLPVHEYNETNSTIFSLYSVK